MFTGNCLRPIELGSKRGYTEQVSSVWASCLREVACQVQLWRPSDCSVDVAAEDARHVCSFNF